MTNCADIYRSLTVLPNGLSTSVLVLTAVDGSCVIFTADALAGLTSLPPIPANIITPVSGSTVTLYDARPVYVNTNALASLTFHLPDISLSQLGQVIEISFKSPVTVLTLLTNTGEAIPNFPTSAYGPGAALQFRFEAPGWIYWK